MISRENNLRQFSRGAGRREKCRWHADAERPKVAIIPFPNWKLSQQRYLTLEHAMSSFVVSQQRQCLLHTAQETNKSAVATPPARNLISTAHDMAKKFEFGALR